MNHSARRTGPALEAHYQFMLWLIPAVEKFPRAQKFLLGDRINHAILKAEFRRRIACEHTLWLMDTIVDHSNPQEPVTLHFLGDDLF